MFWLALLATMAGISSAELCREVDYTHELGPTRHQGETGWCYAHSAADLVSQHLKVRVSAVDLATTYLLTDLDKVRSTPDFFARTRRWRLEDPQSYVPGRIYSDRGLYFLGGLDQDAILMSNLRGFCADSALPGGPALFTQYMREVRHIWSTPRLRDACLEQSKREIHRIGSMPSPLSQDMARVFQCFVDQKCGQRIQPARPVVADTLEVASDVDEFYDGIKSGRIDPKAAEKLMFDKIDGLLDEGKIISIGWDASDVYDSDGPGADHATTIVARKMIKGVCHYRIRDNYGTQCYDYRPGFKGFCDKATGGTWFARGQIPSIYGLVWIR